MKTNPTESAIGATLRTLTLAGCLSAAMGLRAAVVAATYTTGAEVPLTAGSIATGDTVAFTLNYAPAVGTELMVVRNPGLGFIGGTFANLGQGQGVALTFAATTYNFVANYFGGTGNDLVLVWANTKRPFAWAGNFYGEVGNNTNAQTHLPAAVVKSGVLATKTVVALSTGVGHSLALNADGTMAAWGWNLYSQLGDGGISNSTVPVLVNTSAVPAGERIAAISAGNRFNLALCSNGRVLGWGVNDAGQLGNNTNNGYSTPQFVNATGVLAGKTVVAIAAGFNHSLAVCSDGTVAAWGNNNQGQVGAGSSTIQILLPVLVSTSGVLAGKSVVAVAGGYAHSLALCSDGTVAAWGWNPSGQLGNNSTSQSLVPVLVNTAGALNGKTVVAIAAGDRHSLALCSDGTVAAWGVNSNGQLGNNTTTASLVPVNVTSSGVLATKTVVAIAAGASHTLVRCSDGTAATWGNNFSGQLGDNTTTASLVPVAVDMSTLGPGARFTGIFSGQASSHSLALVAGPPAPIPEIDVLGNNLIIPPGAAVPTLANHSDFGSVAEAGNATLTRTFTIRNTGAADLNLTGTPDLIAVSGTNAADFTVTAVPAALVAALTGTTPFQVTFNPSAIGLRTAIISIANNDTDKHPYVFAIQGNGTAPQMLVRGLSVTILDGNTTPTGGDATAFGDVLLCGGTPVTHTFSIHNFGNTPLNLTGNPIVTVGGANPTNFAVSQPAAATVAASDTVTFTVTFTPGTLGPRTAIISLANDDPAVNPYDFVVGGNGVGPEIDVSGGGNVSIVDGNSTPSVTDGTDFGSILLGGGTPVTHTFTLTNTGTAPLVLTPTPNPVIVTGLNAGEFTVTQPVPTTIPAGGGTATFTITFMPTGAGTRTATITLASNDCDESAYDFALQGNGIATPEIEVTGGSPAAVILNGDLSPVVTDGTMFGDFLVHAGASPPHPFTIHNLGTGILHVTAITSSNAGEFPVGAITPALPAAVVAGGTMTFNVSFDPPFPTLRTSNLSIVSNDADEGTYVFAVQGNGLAPILIVSGLSVAIPDGDVTPNLGDATDFGDGPMCGAAPVMHTFTLRNSGNGPLNVTGISLGGVNPSNFTLSPLTFPLTIPPSGLTSFNVTFLPGAIGLRSATLTVAHDDSPANPHDFLISGNGVAPEIDLSGGSGAGIVAGSILPLVANGTDFGGMAVSGGTPVTHTFTITNSGNAALHLTPAGAPVVLSGLNAGEFTVTQPALNPIPAGASTIFTVTFLPTGAGGRTATLTLANDDCDEATSTFAIKGLGLGPQMLVQDGISLLTIANGDLLPGLPDHTDFGNFPVSGGFTQPRYFNIQNLGSTPLHIPAGGIVSSNPAEFMVVATSQPLPATINPGISNTMFFSVIFNPGAAGLSLETITIANDDPAANPYVFAVQGNGTGNPEIAVSGNGVNITNGATLISSLPDDGREFGAVVWNGGAFATHTFTITNSGPVPLTISGLTSNVAEFTTPVLTTPVIIPAITGTTTFDVTYDPVAFGPQTATLTIFNDDFGDNPFTFTVHGRGQDAVLPKPNIGIFGNGTLINLGDLTPNLGDHTTFPATSVTGATTSLRTFTLTNSGGAALNIASVTLGGVNAADFTLTGPIPTSIPGSTSQTFDVTFDPSAAGIRWATVSVASNVTGLSPYTFAINGEGTLLLQVAAEIEVTGNNLNIIDGDIFPSPLDHTNFGSVWVFGGSRERTFTIHNSAFGSLSVGTVTVIGGNALPGEFTVTQQPAASVSGGSTTTFKVKFDPAVTGTRTAYVSFVNGDANESPFNFAIRGTGLWWWHGGGGWVFTGTATAWVPLIDVHGALHPFDNGSGPLIALGRPTGLAWGGNGFGQLGNHSTVATRVPVAVDATGILGGRRIVDLAAGENHTVALCADGTLAAWGQGSAGQLGNGTMVDSLVPVAVTLTGALAGRTVVAIAAGQLHTLALCADGTVVAWGAGASGQLGHNATTASAVPVLVDTSGALSGRTVVSIAAGERHSVALCADGTAVTWGGNAYGQLGNGTTADSAVPVTALTTGATSPLSGRTIAAIAAGASHTLVLCSDGSVAGWGRNHAGQLGDSTMIDRLGPALVNIAGQLAGKTVVALAAGGAHSLALCSDDTLVAWGDNSSGQLGDGTRTNRNVPVAVNRATALADQTIVALAAGAGHSLVLTADGMLAAWGANSDGQLGTNDTANRTVPTAVAFGPLPPGSQFTLVTGGASARRTVALAAAPAPAIGVAGSTMGVPNASGLSGIGDDTDFGRVVVNTGTALRTFTITNTGGAALNLTGAPKVAVSGAHTAEFTVTQQPVSPVATLGGTSTFTVTFAPTAAGLRTATLTLATDDPMAAAFVCDLQGIGTAAGSLDGGANGNANNLVFTTAVQPDGKNVLGGNFTAFGGATPHRAARLGADGTLDLSFNPDVNNSVSSVLVQTDGAIVLGGSFTTVGGVTRNRLARVDANGALDSGFDPDADAPVSGLAIQPDGKIVIAGPFTVVGGAARNHLARLNPNGTPDTGFDPNANRSVYTAAVQADGKIVLGGNFDTVGGVTRNRIARVNADGTLDTGFDPNANSDVTSLAVQPDGKIVIGGQFSTVGGVTRNRVARLNADGTPDLGFDPNVDSAVYTLALQADGKIIVGGSFNTVGGVARVRVARLHANGTLDAGFIASADDDLAYSAALQADGKIVLAGAFTSVNGVPRNFLARLDNDAAFQSLTVTGGNRVQWLRGGTSPETLHVTFERSTDAGGTWTLLGTGVRFGGAAGAGWELTGPSFTGNGLIRARARTTGGAYTGSSGLVETVTTYSVAAQPVITTHPLGQTVAVGANASFTVVATGTPAPTFQWMKGNAAGANPIPGATGSILVLTNVQTADAGSYLVVVTNSTGTVNSAAANLAVTLTAVAPVILTPPGAQTVTAGGNAGFTVVATGSPALMYQWRKNTTVIPGATGPALFFNAAPADAGSYDVIVSNSAGSITSAAGLLTVNVPPAITVQPQSLAVGIGTGTVLSVTATGTAPLAYQWSKDNTPIPGATTSSLTLGNLTLAATGVYRVAVGNVAGNRLSDSANLTVVDAHATHAVSGAGYQAGGTVTVFNTLTYGNATAGLGWQLLLPPGWSYASGSGNEGDVKPTVGATNLVEWAWTDIPTTPIAFAYTLNVPAGTTGNHSLVALALFRQSGTLAQVIATPDPLVISQVTIHSADSNRDNRISLLELTRVIEIYNTRFGTTRTGCYLVEAGTEDGFAPDPTRVGATIVTLTTYHSADTDRNGKLGLLELTRVIELYNTRSGTTRTGQYHVQSGTEDGFAPGP